jgi:zinc transport system ATP-binding protein
MVKTENLYFSYTGSQPYILGENGSGKSTLMRLILNFLRPTRGSISNSAKRIGYMPQKKDFTNSGFPITVYEMLNSYRRLLKLKDKGIMEEALRQVGLSGLSGELMGNLSGGQSQKALIARALMGSPELLILDEPSSGVDNDSQKEIYRLIKNLNLEKGMTIISVEHNLDAAIANSTLIYHVAEGRGHICTPQHYAEEYLKSGKRECGDA